MARDGVMPALLPATRRNGQLGPVVVEVVGIDSHSAAPDGNGLGSTQQRKSAAQNRLSQQTSVKPRIPCLAGGLWHQQAGMAGRPPATGSLRCPRYAPRIGAGKSARQVR
jgi:hypothetical protein